MTAPFDAIAGRYDELWTNTRAGRSQREAVWREIDSLFRPGDRVIDVGCGTGEDALHLMQAGVEVSAYDASPEMVRVARSRGVAAQVLSIEDLVAREIVPAETWHGLLSNFGALNCVRHAPAALVRLAGLVRPGGDLVLCVIGRFCLAETLQFLVNGQLRKATRRWGGESESATLGVRVFYPTIGQIKRALAPDFRLIRVLGIGMCPPRLARLPFFRALCDHRLLIFSRNGVRK